jgi:hypothetical protein
VASGTPNGATCGRRPGTRRLRAACAAVVGALLTGVALAAGAPAPTRPAAPAATLSDCRNLLKQFDVAWPAHRESARATGARHSRDLGEADCQGGRYADGVHNLRRALHDIGVKPVKNVSLPPPH